MVENVNVLLYFGGLGEGGIILLIYGSKVSMITGEGIG